MLKKITKKNKIKIHKDKWVELRMKICPCCKKHELNTGLGDLDVDVVIVGKDINK